MEEKSCPSAMNRSAGDAPGIACDGAAPNEAKPGCGGGGGCCAGAAAKAAHSSFAAGAGGAAKASPGGADRAGVGALWNEAKPSSAAGAPWNAAKPSSVVAEVVEAPAVSNAPKSSSPPPRLRSSKSATGAAGSGSLGTGLESRRSGSYEFRRDRSKPPPPE